MFKITDGTDLDDYLDWLLGDKDGLQEEEEEEDEED